jgi:hypothetical protein
MLRPLLLLGRGGESLIPPPALRRLDDDDRTGEAVPHGIWATAERALWFAWTGRPTEARVVSAPPTVSRPPPTPVATACWRTPRRSNPTSVLILYCAAAENAGFWASRDPSPVR